MVMLSDPRDFNLQNFRTHKLEISGILMSIFLIHRMMPFCSEIVKRHTFENPLN